MLSFNVFGKDDVGLAKSGWANDDKPRLRTTVGQNGFIRRFTFDLATAIRASSPILRDSFLWQCSFF